MGARRSHSKKRVSVLKMLMLFLNGVASTEFIRHDAVHPGLRYGDVWKETNEPNLGICGIRCSIVASSCYAFNYRESDQSCQLVLKGKIKLVKAEGYTAYANNLMCVSEHPTIRYANVSFEDWSGEYPAPPRAKAILTCEHPEGFSDGSPPHCKRECDVLVWGHCIAPNECQSFESGGNYTGTKNTTKSGLPCQPWMSNSPNIIETERYYTNWSLFPDDLYPSHNFCRNPNSDPEGSWCWNGAGTDPKWDHCDIPRC